MDRAYDRTKPDWTRRIRPDVPPTVAATVLTSPSTPLLSKYTDSLVSHCPGRISSDSLTASPYRSLRAAVTGNRAAGAVAATGTRPYMYHASTPAATTSTRATIPAGLNTAGSGGTKPVTG